MLTFVFQVRKVRAVAEASQDHAVHKVRSVRRECPEREVSVVKPASRDVKAGTDCQVPREIQASRARVARGEIADKTALWARQDRSDNQARRDRKDRTETRAEKAPVVLAVCQDSAVPTVPPVNQVMPDVRASAANQVRKVTADRRAHPVLPAHPALQDPRVRQAPRVPTEILERQARVASTARAVWTAKSARQDHVVNAASQDHAAR